MFFIHNSMFLTSTLSIAHGDHAATNTAT